MTPDELRSMRRELVKTANVGRLMMRYTRPLVARAGAIPGAVVGAGLGAGTGVAGEALSGGNNYGGAALRGAAIGGLAGGVSGGTIAKAKDINILTGKRGLELAKEMGSRTRQRLSQFGKAQVHGLTGWKPKGGGPEALGLANRNRGRDQARIALARGKERIEGVTDAKKLQKLRASSIGATREALRRGEMGEEVYQAGLTSIPGVVKGLVRDPKKTLGTAYRAAKAQGLKGAIGIPAALGAAEIAGGTEATEVGGGFVGDVAGMGLAGAMPILPQTVAWSALSSAGRAAGRALKKKPSPKVSVPTPAMAGVHPGEESLAV